MPVFSFATPQMIPRLRAIWQECFGDSAEYLDLYFGSRFRCDQTLVCLESGNPQAMLTLLPARLRLRGEWLRVRYIYAVATQKVSRGQGLSTQLLHYANHWLEQQGEYLSILVPASSDLFGFYARRGYSEAFSIKEVEFAVPPGEAALVQDIEPSEYKRLRDYTFEREGYLCWDEQAIAYAIQENKENGGFCCKFSWKSGQGAALCYTIGHKLIIREAALPQKKAAAALGALARSKGCSKVWARLPADSPIPGAVRPFGMTSRPFAAQCAYLNLVLD